MPVIDLTNKQSKKITLNKHTRLPRDRYQLRCMSEEFALAKSTSNPMVVRKFEFITESVTLPGGTVLMLAGTEVTKYYALKSNGTDTNSAEEATDILLDTFKDDTIKIGGETDWTQFDSEKPPLVCNGKIFEALCGSKEKVERKAPAPGKKVGEPILGLDKKPLVSYEINIIEILGPATDEMNVPF